MSRVRAPLSSMRRMVERLDRLEKEVDAVGDVHRLPKEEVMDVATKLAKILQLGPKINKLDWAIWEANN